MSTLFFFLVFSLLHVSVAPISYHSACDWLILALTSNNPSPQVKPTWTHKGNKYSSQSETGGMCIYLVAGVVTRSEKSHRSIYNFRQNRVKHTEKPVPARGTSQLCCFVCWSHLCGLWSGTFSPTRTNGKTIFSPGFTLQMFSVWLITMLTTWQIAPNSFFLCPQIMNNVIQQMTFIEVYVTNMQKKGSHDRDNTVHTYTYKHSSSPIP